MSYHHFTASQELYSDIHRIWNFFSTPRNLISLTPPKMKLRLIASSSETLSDNTIIDLSVVPFGFIKLRWRTIIRDVKPFISFRDIQLSGPYQYTFQSTPNGVLVSDHVLYQVPFSHAGDLINKLIVKKRITELFEYRRKVLDKLFN
jgi:ligand-binding SRPBCC domain-containing protein